MTDIPREFGDRSDLPGESIDRLAAPLRAPVALDEEFEGRVMQAVRGAGARVGAPATAWWRRRYTLHVTPLAGLALAASLAFFALLGRMSAGAGHRVDSARVAAAATAHDTVYLVRFALVNPDAHAVSLVGDFNGWTPGATPLTGQAVDGVWTASVAVTPGRHEYAFIVDGERWVADPYAATVNDEFGTSSSVLHVGDARHGSPDAQPAI